MSGSNPFRRRQPTHVDNEASNLRDDDEVARATSRFPPLDTELTRHTPNTKGKTVRIQSPHSSTSDSDDNDDDRARHYFEATSRYRKGPHSPVPLSSAFRSAKKASPTDPFGAGSGLDESSDEEEPSLNPEHNPSIATKKAEETSSLSSTASWNAPPSLGSEETRSNDVGDGFHELNLLEKNAQPVPPKVQMAGTIKGSNPFLKTPTPGLTGEKILNSAQQEIPTQGSNVSAITGGKIHLDVDAFKRLLLTGDKDSNVKNAPIFPTTHTAPLQFTHGDNSSNTDASSLSRQSILDSQTDLRLETPRTSHELSASDEDQQSKASARSPKSGRFLPPVPRSRGGKILKSNSPKTANLANSGSSKSQDHPGAQPTLPAPKSPTDLNKPLPPPPTTDLPEIPLRSSPEPVATAEQRPRIPPTPPMSRRHSQLRSTYSSGSPRASTSIAEEFSAELYNYGSPSSIIAKPPAPPPPPRRRGADRSQSSSENPSLTDVSVQAKSQITKPLPPPSRKPSVSSIKLPTRASPSTSIGSTTAPPPPPRRRASSVSSFSSSHISVETNHLDSGSKVTAQHARSNDQTIPLPAEGKDIMADLSALQREVDALRGKYGKGPNE